MKVSIDVHMYNNWSIVDDVMMKIFKILLRIPQFPYSIYQLLFFPKVQFLTFFMHVIHSVILERSTTIECWIF